MTLNDLERPFTLNFHYYEGPFGKLFLHTYCRVCLHT